MNVETGQYIRSLLSPRIYQVTEIRDGLVYLKNVEYGSHLALRLKAMDDMYVADDEMAKVFLLGEKR